MMRRVICHGLSIWFRSMICIAFRAGHLKANGAEGTQKQLGAELKKTV